MKRGDRVMKTLYLGLNLPEEGGHYIHYPMIRIVPRPHDDEEIAAMAAKWATFTHLLFTSRTAVSLLKKACSHYRLDYSCKKGIAVGEKTAGEMERCGFSVDDIAAKEQAEGIVEILHHKKWDDTNILYPHSALARPLIANYLKERGIEYHAAALYDTIPHFPNDLPNFDEIDAILFTSPSTVDAFIARFVTFPQGVTLQSIGPITRKKLNECQKRVVELQ